VNNSFFDAMLVVIIGSVAYVMVKLGFPVAPIVLGLILGPIIEPNMRRALLGSDLNPLVFISTPISGGLLVLSFILVYVMNKRGQRLSGGSFHFQFIPSSVDFALPYYSTV
jgi:putative tricarboxylic transport membrane protein